MNKPAKKNIIVLLATLVFTMAFATTCFAKSSPTATVIPTTTARPTTKAPTTAKPTKNNETTKKARKKQKTTKKDETTTGSGSGNGKYDGRGGNAPNNVDPNNPNSNSKTGQRNSSGISPKTGSSIIIPIAGLLVAAGAIIISRKELTDNK